MTDTYRPGQIVVWRNHEILDEHIGGIVQLTVSASELYAPASHWYCETLSGHDTWLVSESFIIGEAILPEPQ